MLLVSTSLHRTIRATQHVDRLHYPNTRSQLFCTPPIAIRQRKNKASSAATHMASRLESAGLIVTWYVSQLNTNLGPTASPTNHARGHVPCKSVPWVKKCSEVRASSLPDGARLRECLSQDRRGRSRTLHTLRSSTPWRPMCSQLRQDSPSKSGRALLNGTLPLRYCAARFAYSTPTWRLPASGNVGRLVAAPSDAAGNRGGEFIVLGVHRVSWSGPDKKRFRLNRKTPAHLAGLLTHSQPRVWKRQRHVGFSRISMPDHTRRRCDHAYGVQLLKTGLGWGNSLGLCRPTSHAFLIS